MKSKYHSTRNKLSRKSRKFQKQTRKAKHDSILHHHLLIRCELGVRLFKTDTTRLQSLLDDITRDIQMKKLGATQTFWVDGDKVREGITGLNVIETSHIAAHFWNYPERRILHHPKSRALLQFDIYTCSRLTNHQIITALEHLDQFQPTHASITLLNRKWSLTIDRHMNWTLPSRLSSSRTSNHNRSSNRGGETWKEWLEKQKIT